MSNIEPKLLTSAHLLNIELGLRSTGASQVQTRALLGHIAAQECELDRLRLGLRTTIVQEEKLEQQLNELRVALDILRNRVREWHRNDETQPVASNLSKALTDADNLLTCVAPKGEK